jgi:hypothetical protein
MTEPTMSNLSLDERARIVRQGQREQTLRHMKSVLRADDLDMGRTYREILEQILLIVQDELAALSPPEEGA